MKPSNFYLNSDYLTLANIDKLNFTATITGAVLPSSGQYTIEYTFNCKNVGQTISRFYMHHSLWDDPDLWGVGRFGSMAWKQGSADVYEDFLILTPTNSTIKLKIFLSGTADTHVNQHTIKIKAFRFKVPNVF